MEKINKSQCLKGMYSRAIYLLALGILFGVNGMAQTLKTDSINIIGGISMNVDNQIILEDAQYGIYYKFDYKVSDNKKEINLCDTLYLACGRMQSVFLDPLYKENMELNRKDRIKISTRKNFKTISFDHQNLDEIADFVDINSDYKEYSAGDPIQIYKDKTKRMITSVYNSYSNNVRCEQSADKLLNWKISNDTATVLGYACRKAGVQYAGRHYTAWFTMDISLNDGPWKFQGLPGLILKVEDDQHLFQWTAIGLQELKKAKIVTDKVKYETVSVKQFNEYVNKETNNVMVRFYHDDILYFSYKKSRMVNIPVEL